MTQQELQIQFGNTIRQLRQARGFTQEQLANAADVDRRYMSDVENGRRNISLSVIERLATALGISLTDLFRNLDQQP